MISQPPTDHAPSSQHYSVALLSKPSHSDLVVAVLLHTTRSIIRHGKTSNSKPNQSLGKPDQSKMKFTGVISEVAAVKFD